MFGQALLESHFNLIPFQVYVANVADYTIVFANDRMTEVHGDLKGKTCYQALHGINVPCDFCPIHAVLTDEGMPNGQIYDFDYFNEVEDCWYQVKSRAMGWSDGSIVAQSIRVDVTELKEAQSKLAEAHATMAIQNRKLARASITDNLTKLANRLRLDEVMQLETQHALSEGTPLSAILLDIDLFKSVNDTFGHNVGDIVIKEIAAILSKGVRAEDTPGRWGGEEFLILMPATNLSGAMEMAENLRKQIEEHRFAEVGQKTSSFGVAQFCEGETITSFINRADEALYEAKESGRNSVVGK